MLNFSIVEIVTLHLLPLLLSLIYFSTDVIVTVSYFGSKRAPLAIVLCPATYFQHSRWTLSYRSLWNTRTFLLTHERVSLGYS